MTKAKVKSAPWVTMCMTMRLNHCIHHHHNHHHHPHHQHCCQCLQYSPLLVVNWLVHDSGLDYVCRAAKNSWDQAWDSTARWGHSKPLPDASLLTCKARHKGLHWHPRLTVRTSHTEHYGIYTLWFPYLTLSWDIIQGTRWEVTCLSNYLLCCFFDKLIDTKCEWEINVFTHSLLSLCECKWKWVNACVSVRQTD